MKMGQREERRANRREAFLSFDPAARFPGWAGRGLLVLARPLLWRLKKAIVSCEERRWRKRNGKNSQNPGYGFRSLDR
jgi:hypothetical protein